MVLQTHLHVLAQGLAFLLGERSHDRQHHFTLGVHGIDSFLLKYHRDVLVLQLPDVFQAFQRIPGKPADRLGDDHVNIAGHARFDHAIELFAVLGVSPVFVPQKCVFTQILGIN